MVTLYLVTSCVLGLYVHNCQAVPYTGTFCQGVVDFQIKNGTNVDETDTTAKQGYSTFPRWVTPGCLTALWKYTCVQVYGQVAADKGGYCAASCLQTLSDCEETLKVLPGADASAYQTFLVRSCEKPHTSGPPNCHGGGNVQYSDIPSNYSTVCPKPLGEVQQNSQTDTERIHGTACNTGCPSPVFTDREWNSVKEVATWCTLASAILSGVIILTHSEDKNLYIRHLNSGALVVNVCLFIFMIVNKYESQTCLSHGYYHKHTPLCYFQAALTVGAYLWMAVWQACIAVNLWLTIVIQAKKPVLDRLRSKYLPTAAALAIISPAVCLAGGNLGFDWAGYSGPVCLFLYSENPVYYWALLFTPVVLVVIICLALTIHTIAHVNHVLVQQKNPDDTFFKRMSKILKYNKKLVLFICCFCLLGGYQSGQVLYENLAPGHGFKSSARDFVKCLLENTLDDPNTGMAACGDYPNERPPIWRVILLVTYASTIGIMSFLVYGTQNKATKSVSSKISSSIKRFRSIRSGQSTEERQLFSDPSVSTSTRSWLSGPSRSTSTFAEFVRSSFVSITYRLTHIDGSYQIRASYAVELPSDDDR